MLILASASPRRQELLRNAGIDFTVRPAHVNEDLLENEDPVAYVTRLARAKARAVWDDLKTEDRRPMTVVLGADTTVVVDRHILAKPENADDAKRMLRLLSGRTHEVLTGVHLAGEGIDDTRSECTRVTFDPLSEEDIAMYIAHGEPMDKAGAYAIQGIASRWIPRIEGCYFNVVGLPVPLVCRMLGELRMKK
ncbi:MAG: Maf family protein [Terriglobales bacterium]